jgi:hypothetical protein
MSFGDQFSQFPTWNLVLWVIWAGMFAVLETMGVWRGDKFATLTYLSLHSVPRWALAMFLGWLCYHFMLQYMMSK